MEFAENGLFDNQDFQLLQVKELPSTYNNEELNQEKLIQAMVMEYHMEHYGTSTMSTSLETHSQVQQATSVVDEEGILNAKELKNLKAWKSQGRFGSFVEGTKILPCKTFLCEERWFDYLDADEHFHIKDLISHLEKLGLKIGLILDLNRSTTYYNFEKAKLTCPLLNQTRYHKFKLENGTVPCEEAVAEVCQLLKEAHERDEVVAVHCFNGLNRTGYMICEFLCRHLGLDGETAIKRFENARLHKIEHECMTVELKNKYAAK